MNAYVACSVTQDQDCGLVDSIIRYLQSCGHTVLDEHVRYPREEGRIRFAQNCGISEHEWDQLSVEEKEKRIRSNDLHWVENAEIFIALCFAPSFGIGIEFEHLCLLIKLQKLDLLKRHITRNQLFLCIFLNSEDGRRSAMIHGLDHIERTFITQEFIDRPEQALDVVRRYV